MAVPVLLGVLALCTRLYAPGRGSTCLHWFFFVCWPCARGNMPLYVDPRDHTGLFWRVRPMLVAVRLWIRIQVPVPALLAVLAMCTWLLASGGCFT